MVSALFSGLYSLPIYIKKRHKFGIIFKKDNLIKGAIVMFALVGLVFFKAYALVLTPNPSYVVAMCFTSTIWVYAANMIYTFFTKKKVRNKINFKTLILLIISTVMLILVTR
jgi:hypothetical protein